MFGKTAILIVISLGIIATCVEADFNFHPIQISYLVLLAVLAVLAILSFSNSIVGLWHLPSFVSLLREVFFVVLVENFS